MCTQLFKISKITPERSEIEIASTAILVRVYGANTDQLVDRNIEADVHSQLAELDLAAPLLARFQNGLLYRFIPGHVCSAHDLTQEVTWKAVAAKLGEWHARLSNPGSTSQEPSTVNGVAESISAQTSSTTAQDLLSRKPFPNIWTEMQQWISILPTGNRAQIERKKSLERELKTCFAELDSTCGLGDRGVSTNNSVAMQFES
jgi:ethanolamine kinase